MRLSNIAFPALLLSALSATIAGCNVPPADDAAGVAFAHQAVQAVLGRRARGTAEVSALAAVFDLHGPGVVVDLLVQEPEFADYWSTVIADAMQVQRSGDLALGNRACVNNTTYLSSGGNPALLAAHLRLDPSTTMFDPDGDGIPNAWTLGDAIRTAILVDDLQLAWRPWMFLLGRPAANVSAEERRKNYLASAFNVQTDCVSCHSSTYSKTEAYGALAAYPDYTSTTWDRTATLGFALESTLFGTGNTIPVGANTKYDNTCRGCHGDGTSLPSDQLFDENGDPVLDGFGNPVYPIAPKPLTHRVPLLPLKAIAAQAQNGGGLMQPTGITEAKAESIAETLREQLGGYEDMDPYLSAAQFVAATTPWGIDASCGINWAPGLVVNARTYAFGGISRTTTDVRDIVSTVEQGVVALGAEPLMPPGTPASPALRTPNDSTSAAGALFVANMADDLLEELAGSRATVAHGMPRNPDQAYAIWAVGGALRVQSGNTATLSLRTALREALSSRWYNRKAPSDSALAPYQLAMIYNPWAATEPAGGAIGVHGSPNQNGDNVNGQGDFVHRRSPNQLLWSLRSDLGWPSPTTYPNTASMVYPSATWMRQLGRYEATKTAGSTLWQFDSVLFWEQQVGMCANPTGTDDWIDKLVADVNSAGTSPVPAASGASSTTTLRDMVKTLKDRLLQETTLDPAAGGEEEMIASIFVRNAGVVPPVPVTLILNQAASTWAGKSAKKAAVKSALREVCGVLLMSPDYLMAGVPTVTTAQTAPPITLCLPSENTALMCRPADIKAHYCTKLGTLGLACPP